MQAVRSAQGYLPSTSLLHMGASMVIATSSSSVFRRSHAVLACAVMLGVGASALAAQDVSVVVPSSAASADGNRWMNSHFRANSTRRIQILIDARHVAGLAGKQLRELAFRKDLLFLSEYGRLRGGEGAAMRVYASFSDASVAQPSVDFAKNRGAQHRLVFDGVVSLPKVAADEDRRVTSFDAAEAPTLALLPGFWHEAQRTLVLEFETRVNAANARWTWPVDAVTQFEPGSTAVIGKPCWDTPAKPDATRVVKGSLRPGMHMRVTSDAPPSPVAAFLMIGLSDKFAFGTLPLPLRVAEPGCDVVVSPDLFLTSTFFSGASTTDSGWTANVFGLPSAQNLYGATLYMQYLFLHMEGGQPAVKTANGLAATLTKNAPSLGASMVVTMDSAAATGRVFLDFAPVLRITAR